MQKSNNTEHLSPWGNSNGWSFDPQSITVITRNKNSSEDDYYKPRKRFELPELSHAQLATVMLVLFSVGMLAILATIIIF